MAHVTWALEFLQSMKKRKRSRLPPSPCSPPVGSSCQLDPLTGQETAHVQGEEMKMNAANTSQDIF